MLQVILKYTKRPFVRNVATVAGGTAVSQVIIIALSPLMTRLYGPEAYGIQGVFISVVAVTSTVAALSYPLAIVLPKSDTDALALSRLSIYIGLGMAAIITILLYSYGEDYLQLINAGEIAGYIYLIPLAMLITVAYGIVGQWLIRKEAFFFIAKVDVGSSLIVSAVKVTLGLLSPTAGSLIISNIMGNILRVVMNLWGARKLLYGDGVVETVDTPRLKMWELVRRYSDFALLRTPQVFINALSVNLPVVMLAKYFGASAVGLYAIASSVMAVPGTLIGGSVMKVFYPKITEVYRRREDVRALIIKATIGLALSGLIPLAIVVLEGPFLFSFVFGAEWEKAGVYAQWLSVWLFFQYVNKPAVSAIPVLRIQRGLLIYEIFSTSSKVVALSLGVFVYHSDVVAIALFSMTGVIAYVWLILWVIMHAGKLRDISDNRI